MGIFLNPDPWLFQESREYELYVDKTELIAHTNKMLRTPQKYACVSRPRRFGKTMAANMLAAYYTCAYDTASLFEGLVIAEDPSFRKHLNRYHVIKLDMQSFMTDRQVESVTAMLVLLVSLIVHEIKDTFPDIQFFDETRLPLVLTKVYQETGKQFVFLLDEWDCVMRRIHDWEEQKLYLDFLRNFLKDQPYVAFAYMTGILPIKKYGEHSTLNMFSEYSMIQSHSLVPYFGFTEAEVQTLCMRFDMDWQTMQDWYDGYRFWTGQEGEKISIYSPRSVVMSILNRQVASYWTATENYTALKNYIEMNIDGLRDDIVAMLAGGEVEVNTNAFQNDMSTFQSRDDVLTLLVHLGYLSYHADTRTVVIPNKEVAQEFVTSIQFSHSYNEIYASVKDSQQLLTALWEKDGDAVAAGVEKAHMQFPSIRYNNENALSCVIELALYYAREYYTIIRELPTGKGFADICYLPKPRHSDKPAVLVELKWDKSTETAMDQIKRKEYPAALAAYQGNLLLCGISYDKEGATGEKKHRCVIETFVKALST